MCESSFVTLECELVSRRRFTYELIVGRGRTGFVLRFRGSWHARLVKAKPDYADRPNSAAIQHGPIAATAKIIAGMSIKAKGHWLGS